MSFVTDQDDGIPFLGIPYGLEMDLDHQGAGGVDRQEPSLPGLFANLRGDAVGTVEQGRARRDFLERLDEYGAPLAEPFDNEFVVHDLVIDVERRSEELERTFEAFDGHVHASAEAAGIRQNDLHREPTS